MSLSVSKRMAAIRPSPTGAVLALATELRTAGRDIISLGAGEPDFDTPQHIKDAAHDAIRAGATKYTPIDGTAELKAAIQQKFLHENQLSYDASQIVVSSGAKQCLFNLCLGLLGPGDEAIIPAPYWVSYPDMVRLAGAEPVVIGAGIEDDFKITPAQLAEAITDRTRLLILNSPSNPTGASASSFIRTWKRAKYWGILVLKPGEIPASPDADKYVRAVAAIEAIGDIDSAVVGYDAAIERWPEHTLAQLGLGNSFYAQGDLIAAETAFKKVLSMEPDDLIALNNLLQVQMDRGCFADATLTVDFALSIAQPNSTMFVTFQNARKEIELKNSSAACF